MVGSQLQASVICRSDDGGQHMWTHRNRGGANQSVQQIDFFPTSKSLARELVSIQRETQMSPIHIRSVNTLRWWTSLDKQCDHETTLVSERQFIVPVPVRQTVCLRVRRPLAIV